VASLAVCVHHISHLAKETVPGSIGIFNHHIQGQSVAFFNIVKPIHNARLGEFDTPGIAYAHIYGLAIRRVNIELLNSSFHLEIPLEFLNVVWFACDNRLAHNSAFVKHFLCIFQKNF
jgi:hypothetical protein